MKVSIFGTSYVGLVTGACLAEISHQVICVDIDKEKIEKLNRGENPFYEPNLEEMVKRNHTRKNLFFTTNMDEALEECRMVFVCVGTPANSDGSVNLEYVYRLGEQIGDRLTKDIVFVVKSTVPVGTTEAIGKMIDAQLKKRELSLTVSLVSNPEFLKEGSAVQDFMEPDRVIVGANSPEVFQVMKRLYAPLIRDENRFISMDIRSSELSKCASNSMLATKISFINEFSRLAEKCGADINKVRIGVGSDSRIGYKFICPGLGYGGSCLPKDVKGLVALGESMGCDMKLMKAVEAVNHDQKLYFFEKILNYFEGSLLEKQFAVWGLSFKPNTDDMRESPSAIIINKLIEEGASISVYDEMATNNAKKLFEHHASKIKYSTNKYDALNDKDALIIITEWKEFSSPDFERIKKRLKSPVIFDGRNQYSSSGLKEKGFIYFQIGVPNEIKSLA